ncbi:hypothetical protein AAEX28_05275 [Lentisphaerota bacterium WC36G]|nr:hypothetical protein LJT99_08130 [Lentisphaerae bacterium WC36]
MKSLLHCVWTGPSCPYSLKSFIRRWVECFRRSRSDFELVLWVTADSYNALSCYLKTGAGNHIDVLNWAPRFVGVDIKFNAVTMNNCRFYVAKIEPLLLKYHSVFRELLTLFQEHGRFTTISNIVRVMALNHCGGIYSDIDYLTSVDPCNFPRSIADIIQQFESSSSLEFYLSVLMIKGRPIIENQCMILSPERIGSLSPLIDKMAHNLQRDMSVIRQEARQYKTFLDNPQNKALNKSMFTEELFYELLKAYRERNYTAFLAANEKIFKNETMQKISHKGSISVFTKKALLDEGHMHESYLMTGQHTYLEVGQFFHDHLSLPLPINQSKLQEAAVQEYGKKYWTRMQKYFKRESMYAQFSFIDDAGSVHGMYSWANPGYSRLTKLEKAVHLVEEKYLQRGIKKELIVNFINEIIHSTSDRISLTYLNAMVENLQSLRDETFSKERTKYILKQLFAIVLVVQDGKLTLMTEVAVNCINKRKFLALKNIIDPEKARICFGDLDQFVLC